MIKRIMYQLYVLFHERKKDVAANPFAILEASFDDSDANIDLCQDCDGYRKWLISSRRNPGNAFPSETEQIEAAIDRFVEVIEQSDEYSIYILRVSHKNFDQVAAIISEVLSIRRTKVRHILKVQFPAVFDCGTQDAVDSLRNRLEGLCVFQ